MSDRAAEGVLVDLIATKLAELGALGTAREAMLIAAAVVEILANNESVDINGADDQVDRLMGELHATRVRYLNQKAMIDRTEALLDRAVDDGRTRISIEDVRDELTGMRTR